MRKRKSARDCRSVFVAPPRESITVEATVTELGAYIIGRGYGKIHISPGWRSVILLDSQTEVGRFRVEIKVIP